jgi:hypothetical protein
MIPGVAPIIDTASSAADTVGTSLDGAVVALDAISVIAAAMTDPMDAAMAASITAVQGFVDGIVAALETGVYAYVDKGPVFNGMPPDGLEAFIDRFESSLGDTGDHDRPVFAEGSSVSLLLFVVGSEDLAAFIPRLNTLGTLFAVPTLRVAVEENLLDFPSWNEGQVSVPPDWAQIPLVRRCPPLVGLARVLQKTVGLLSVGKSYSAMLSNLSAAIGHKAMALANTLTEIDTALAEIEAIIDAQGLYVLAVNANGMEEAMEFIRSADDVPLWTDEAYVAGMCLLGGTADFAPIWTLLGGDE